MAFITTGKLFGKVRESKSGSNYISVQLTIKDLEQFIRSLKKTEYGHTAYGALFVDRENEERFSGSFSITEEQLLALMDTEAEVDTTPPAPDAGPDEAAPKQPKARKLF